MTVKLLSNGDQGQVDALQGSQQGFSSWTAGGALGIARIQSWQNGFCSSQVLAHTELQQGQNAQANRQQANEASRTLVTLQIHGCQRQRFAFEPSKATLHQVFFAVGQDRLLKG